jgi:hypothetical protein
MWFRRQRSVPPLDLSALDRLAELIERIVALLPQLAPEPAAPAGACVETPQAPPVEGHLLFAAGNGGYRLLERPGAPPAAAARVELDGAHYEVLRLGPSPLPLDRRRCAFLEREERPRPERSSGG